MSNIEETTKKRGRKRKNAESVINSETTTTYNDMQDIIAGATNSVQESIETIKLNDDCISDTIQSESEIVVDSENVCIAENETIVEDNIADTTESIEPVPESEPVSNTEKKIEGTKYLLPFARIYKTSVAKNPIGVCVGEVEILSDTVYDGRINVFDHGRKIAGWIDTTELN